MYEKICAALHIDALRPFHKQGPGFREAYLKISNFTNKLPNRLPVGAFTATATTATEAYVINHLGMNDPVVIRGPVTRNNITLNVIPISDELGGIKDADLIEQHKRKIILEWLKHIGSRFIVYSNTIERVESLCGYLRKKALPPTTTMASVRTSPSVCAASARAKPVSWLRPMRLVWASTFRIFVWSFTMRR